MIFQWQENVTHVTNRMYTFTDRYNLSTHYTDYVVKACKKKQQQQQQ
jgi:hypothetical protein